MRTLTACTPALVLILLAAGSTFVDAQGPRRIETAEALTHVLKKVEPEVPPEAVKQKIGGVVIADVSISAAGTVSSVTILDGPPMLHVAAQRALRQWTFKPFLLRGRPGAVQAILEVSFPDPIKEEQNRIFEAHRAATYECQRQLEADATKADRACLEGVRHAEALPPDRILERSHAVASYAHSLMAAGQLPEAIAQFERARMIRATRVKGPNADTADLHQVLALLHQRVGDYDEADEEFASAVGMYTAVQEQLPAMSNSYAPRLQQALIRYAALKRLAGDSAAAEELERRAGRIRAAVADPPRPPEGPTARTAGDLQIIEPPAARLTDDDVRQIQSVLPGAGKKPWRLELRIFQGARGGTQAWRVDAFLEPDVDTRTFRRGRFAYLTTAAPPRTRETNRVWRQVEGSFYYIQVAAAGGEARDNTPIRVQPAPNSPRPSDDELASIVRLVRERAVPVPSQRLLSDIQPWPIKAIMVWSNGDLEVDLSDSVHANRRQGVRMRKAGGEWSVIELRGY